MKSALIYRIIGLAMLSIGVLGVLYCIYGIYMFYSINQALFFLTPAYGGLDALVVVFLVFLAFALLGYRLFQKAKPGAR